MWFISVLLLALCAAVNALSSAGNRLLVIQEEASEKQLYSTLWNDLETRGYSLTFKSPKNEQLSLFQHGVRAYDHLIILPSKSKGLGPSLTPQLLVDFINNEGNILVALSGGAPTSTSVTSLMLELDLHLSPDRNALIVDHFNYDTISAADSHDTLLLSRPHQVRSDLKNYFGGDGILAFPKAAGQALGNASPLLVPILRAPETAYSYDTKEQDQSVDDSFATGSQLSLVSAMQARNSARLTIVGSAESLQDKWFSASVKGPSDGKEVKTVNREFAQQVTSWAFKETGVVQVGRIEHYLTGGAVEEFALSNESRDINPKIYRVKNDVTFNIELSEYVNDHYAPFEVPDNDSVQLEFTMLSPFHRLDLQPTSRTENSTIYSTAFTVPDQHGIFSFRVNYKRPFLTNIEEKHEVTVRHFAHDEYPRSWKITGGWVWIAGLWSVIGGFLAFVLVWLYSAPPQGNQAKKGQ